METKIEFLKKDLLLAVLAGEIVAWLSLPTLKNIGMLNAIGQLGVKPAWFFGFWFLIMPIGAVLGLAVFYVIAKVNNRLGFFQLGKYGVIGVMNTFLNAGIYNVLIFATNIAAGLILDIFFVIAFIITVINSFLWNKYWSFEEKKTDAVGREAANFFGVSAVVALINIAVLHVIVNVVGAPAGIDQKIWANIALVFTIVIAFFGNFFGYKFLVFKK